ncbi:MAG: hypothetical protein AAB897_04225 [Patescibacteria group bacterium]
MNITKCDICGKSPKDKERMAYMRLPDFSSHDVCMQCMKKHSAPLLKKLEAAKAKKSKR